MEMGVVVGSVCACNVLVYPPMRRLQQQGSFSSGIVTTPSTSLTNMPPMDSSYCAGPASTPIVEHPTFKLAFELLAITIGFLSFLAILITGCYGPIGQNEWPLIRSLPDS